jgi:hypothetical protein
LGFVASAMCWWLLDRWVQSQFRHRPWARDAIGKFRPAGDLLPGGLLAHHNIDGVPLTEIEEERVAPLGNSSIVVSGQGS